jgi:hypothetical protein
LLDDGGLVNSFLGKAIICLGGFIGEVKVVCKDFINKISVDFATFRFHSIIFIAFKVDNFVNII